MIAGLALTSTGAMSATAGIAPSLVRSVRWDWPGPSWAMALVLVAGVAWVAMIYAREQRYVSGPRRTALAALRLTAWGAIAAMLAQPVLVRQRVERPTIVVLLDRSGSMSTADVPAAALAPYRAGAPADGRVQRDLAVRDILAGGSQPLLVRLGEAYRIVAASFDRDVAPLDAAAPAAMSEAIRAAAPLDAKQSSAGGTRLGAAIDAAVRQLSARRPAAVLVLSDGVNTEDLSLSAAAARAKVAGVPIFSIVLGSDRARPDVAIEDPVVEQVVFPGDRLEIEATLRGVGYAGREVRVTLTDARDSKLLAETTAIVPADGRVTTARVALRPTAPGALALRLAVDPLPDEQNRSNNATSLAIDVRAEPIRVLLAAATPSYEYRAIKSLLERDPAIELRVRLQDADQAFGEVESAAIGEFPVSQEAISQYDVVILADAAPDLLPRQTWDNLLHFVSVEGGGLALVAGPAHLPRAYAHLRAMEVLSPFSSATLGVQASSAAEPAGFAILPTAIGQGDAALQLGQTREQSARIWEALPPVHWLAAAGAKPGASVLAEARAADGAHLPVIVRQYVGAGEVLMHATDETWRWRRLNDDRYFARYWGQAVRRLARGRARQSDELRTDKPQYAAGETPLLRAIRRGDASRDEVAVALKASDGPTREIILRRRDGYAAMYEASLDNLPPGEYTATLPSEDPSRPAATAMFAIRPVAAESARLTADYEGLADAARMTGGKVYRPGEAQRLPDELPRPTPTTVEQLPDLPLWNNYWIVLTICTALGLEWLLRRRWGML